MRGWVAYVGPHLRYPSEVFEYRVAEVASLLGVSDDTVRRWTEEGRIASRRDEASHVWVDGPSVAAFLTERSQASRLPGIDESSDTRSLRNHFTGIVTSVISDRVMSQVELRCGPFRVVSLISTEAVREMGIEVGRIVVADAKATNISLHLPPRKS